MKYFVLILVLGLFAVGCASTKQSPTHDGPSTPIGEAPQGEEGRVAPPPPGPDLMINQSKRRAPAGEVGEGDIVISRAHIDAFISHGPAFAFSQVDTEPYHDGEAFVGFQIVDVGARAHNYLAPHLRVGDVITHVNGIRIQRPDDYLQAWKGLSEVSSIRVDFVRDEEREHVTWQIR